MREFKLLRLSAEVHKTVDQLFLRRLLCEAHGYGRCMSVQDRNADALRRDERRFRTDDLTALNMAEDLERLELRLLFLAADIRNDISDHLRPVRKCLTRTGNRLICADRDLCRLKFLPCRETCDIALDRAVRLDGDEAALCAEAFLLGFDDLKMLAVDLRDHHGDIRCPAMRAVVGDDRCLGLRVQILDRADLFLGHVHCGKYKIDIRRDRVYLVDVADDHVLYLLRHRSIHFPLSADCLLIGLPRAPAARREDADLIPGVLGKQCDKALPDHTGCSKNTHSQFFTHNTYLHSTALNSGSRFIKECTAGCQLF